MPEPVILTLADLFFHHRESYAGRPELLTIRRHRRREALSSGDFVTAVHSLAVALEARGLKKGERVAIHSENCPEWHVVDFACQILGLVTVPIDAGLPAQQVGLTLRNSGAGWVFYNNLDKLRLLEDLQTSLTQPLRLVAMEDEAREEGGESLTLLMGEGAERMTAMPLDRFRDRVSEEDLASIIYTGGTTGDPKGVMLSHRNLVSNLLACAEVFPLGPGDVALSFLPLSHIFARTADLLFFYQGVSIHYAPSVDRVPSLLREVRPSVLVSVPRLYERILMGIVSGMERQARARRRVVRWALAVGKRHFEAHARGFVGPWLALERCLAEWLVFRRIRRRLGGRLRFAISGGAPLSRQVSEFFEAMGLRLYQGYGLTETSPVLTANHPGHHRLGSVGRPIPGVEIRIAEDGEILARSPGLMQGYWHNPGASKEVIDADGWFHTGDVGHVDGDGFLFITDRKKDLLVTSGGKNIAPQPIEQVLTSNEVIAQALVVGHGYPFVAALLVPRFDSLATELGSLSNAEMAVHPEVLRRVGEIVARVNRRLAEHERIRRWRLLESEFTRERGELTPTQKIRRRIVMQRYSEVIAALYAKPPEMP